MTTTTAPRPIGFLLHDVARLLRRRLDQRAQGSGLTGAQWQVLAALKHNQGLNQSGLADLLDMEPITLSRHIDRLESAGFVERQPDPEDRRARRLYLGPRVAPLMDEMRRVGMEVFSEALTGISKEEADLVVDVLTRMRANIVGKCEVPAAPVTQSGTASLAPKNFKETA